jgi:hypothetical protein
VLKDFWSRVERGAEDDCWLWRGAKTSKGYGLLRWNGKMMRAHRLAYQLHYGDLPDESCVCHSCDVPLCCNPAHLWLGTVGDNARDMVRKDRHHKPETYSPSYARRANPKRREYMRKLQANKRAALKAQR